MNYTMNSNSKVVLVDRRKAHSENHRCITKRFGNCEMREFVMTAWEAEATEQKNGDTEQPVITLEEVTLEMGESADADEINGSRKSETM